MRRGFQHRQAFIQPAGHARQLDGVKLLKAVKGARHRAVFQGGDSRQGHQPLFRSTQVNIPQLLRIEPPVTHQLGDHLVGATVDIEPVDVVAPQRRPQIQTHLALGQSQRRQLLVVEQDLGLGLIDFQIDLRRKVKQPAFHRRLLQSLSPGQHVGGLVGGGDHKLHRKVAAAGQGRRLGHKHLQPGNGVHALLNFRHQLANAARTLIPGLDHHAAESAHPQGGGKGIRRRQQNLKGQRPLRRFQKHPLGRPAKVHLLIRRGVGGVIDNAEHKTLIFQRRQLSGRKQVHGHHQQPQPAPEYIHRRAPGQHPCQPTAIGQPQPVKSVIDPAGEPSLLALGALQQGRTHGGRQGQRHHPGDDHRPGQGQGKLPEQGAGQPALQTDGNIHRRQGHGHGDHRTHQFPGADQRRLFWGAPFPQVPLHVFHHNDGVVHHQPHRQHDGQQGEQVEGEAGQLHQKHGADQRHRNGHHRHQHRAPGAEKQEDDPHHDQQGFHQGADHLANGVVHVFRGVVAYLRREPLGQIRPEFAKIGPHPGDHLDHIGVGQRKDPHKHRGLTVEADLGVIVLRPQLHLGHVFQTDQGIVLAPHHQPAELLGTVQIGIGGKIHLHQRPLGAAHRRQEIIGGQGLAHLGRADAQRRQPFGLQPYPHGKGAGAEDLGPLHPGQGCQPGLHHAHQIIGDLALGQPLGGKAQVGGGKLGVRRLHADGGHLGLGGQLVAYLVDLGGNVGQRLGRRVVELEPGGHQ